MLHPYVHYILHKQEHKQRLKQVEHERLVLLMSESGIQYFALLEVSRMFNRWLANRRKNRAIKHMSPHEVVMPQAK